MEKEKISRVCSRSPSSSNSQAVFGIKMSRAVLTVPSPGEFLLVQFHSCRPIKRSFTYWQLRWKVTKGSYFQHSCIGSRLRKVREECAEGGKLRLSVLSRLSISVFLTILYLADYPVFLFGRAACGSNLIKSDILPLILLGVSQFSLCFPWSNLRLDTLWIRVLSHAQRLTSINHYFLFIECHGICTWHFTGDITLFL